ncbi:MAG: hypothetical protein JST14_01890 [Bacteroidetes bacterium]|nr:hypothetical protein [Bacteroidota bacterium]
MTFLLRKWYLDVMDDNQRGLIAYQAAIKWKNISLNYGGYLPIGTLPVKARSDFSSSSSVEGSDHELHWKVALAHGSWKGDGPVIHQPLLQSEAGSVDWHVIQPLSHAHTSIEGHEVAGRGYVERIDLTLPPWRLPITQLLWGRYVSPLHSVVWIRWIGERPLQFIFHNGNLCPCEVSAECVRFDNYVLTLPKNVIRKGGIGPSVFAGFQKISSLFPSSILSLHEEKWSGICVLKENASVVDEGNVIHERVIWP